MGKRDIPWDYELLNDFICSAKNLIPKAGLKTVLHYYTHDEPEKAYEGLLIELIRYHQYPPNFDFFVWEKLALHYQINIDNVLCDANFNGNFWVKFQNWGKSYCPK